MKLKQIIHEALMERYVNLNETKAFGELRKSNKKLYDDTLKLEESIGPKVLNLLDNGMKNLKFNTDKERELAYLIILDLILDRFLDKTK
jgi:hypothetical protein